MRNRVTVGDLKDQLDTPYPRPVLHCDKCGADYSAHAGDYWNRPANYVFRCCRRNMLLLVRHEVYTEPTR